MSRTESNLVRFGKEELRREGWYEKDSPYNGKIAKAVEELLETFAKQKHSGVSGQIVLNVFEKLARFEPLSPLTGSEDEWRDVGEAGLQNKRYSAVFKDKETGEAYDIEAIVFVDRFGRAFTGWRSKLKITFPYTPKHIYIHEGTPEAEPYKDVFEDVEECDDLL